MTIPFPDPNQYQKPENYNEAVFRSDSEYEKKTITEKVVDAINRMLVYRLIFIALITSYSIIAFSKGEKGVTTDDLSLFIWFIIFVLLIAFLSFLGTELYRFYKKTSSILDFLYNSFLKKIKPNIITIILLICLYLIIINRNDVINLIKNGIEKFIIIN